MVMVPFAMAIKGPHTIFPDGSVATTDEGTVGLAARPKSKIPLATKALINAGVTH